jgi:hypothetical protein
MRVKSSTRRQSRRRGRTSPKRSARRARGSAVPLLGTWKLESFTTEYLDTGETGQPYGAHPIGYLSYGADHRMHAIVARADRKAPDEGVPTDAQKMELFSGMAAYAGTYAISGDVVTHHVDISWNEAWTGTAQVRQFAVAGNVLRIRAETPVNGRPSLSTLVWIKVL